MGGAGKNAWHLIYDEGQTKPDEEVVAGGLEAAKIGRAHV